MSVDPLAESQSLTARLQLTFPLASDTDLRVIRAFGVEMVGGEIALPATFVLAAGTGKVVYQHVGESIFDRPAVQVILRAVERGRAK